MQSESEGSRMTEVHTKGFLSFLLHSLSVTKGPFDTGLVGLCRTQKRAHSVGASKEIPFVLRPFQSGLPFSARGRRECGTVSEILFFISSCV